MQSHTPFSKKNIYSCFYNEKSSDWAKGAGSQEDSPLRLKLTRGYVSVHWSQQVLCQTSYDDSSNSEDRWLFSIFFRCKIPTMTKTDAWQPSNQIYFMVQVVLCNAFLLREYSFRKKYLVTASILRKVHLTLLHISNFRRIYNLHVSYVCFKSVSGY